MAVPRLAFRATSEMMRIKRITSSLLGRLVRFDRILLIGLQRDAASAPAPPLVRLRRSPSAVSADGTGRSGRMGNGQSGRHDRRRSLATAITRRRILAMAAPKGVGIRIHRWRMVGTSRGSRASIGRRRQIRDAVTPRIFKANAIGSLDIAITGRLDHLPQPGQSHVSVDGHAAMTIRHCANVAGLTGSPNSSSTQSRREEKKKIPAELIPPVFAQRAQREREGHTVARSEEDGAADETTLEAIKLATGRRKKNAQGNGGSPSRVDGRESTERKFNFSHRDGGGALAG